MRFQTPINESIFVSKIVPERSYMFDKELKTGLSIIWNTGKEARFMIDDEIITIQKDCVIFLTEYYQIDDFQFEEMNIIQFNRPFHCVDEHNDELGCKGLLFFGGAHVPKIIIPKERRRHFELLWEVFLIEIDEIDGFKLEMLRNLLKRFLILCLRIYKKQNHNLPADNINVGLIREFNYLVEQNFKQLTKVSDYAKLLFKSPKTLSNIFKKYIDKTPLQIINDRRLLEAKRQLKYTDNAIQEIAFDLNFRDVTSFSHFFSVRTGGSPSKFRNSLIS
ncbi:MAG: helix-turn-helix domain-containing protein [Bacteroidetes bacterium]|jgi:AraC-like DNA-binding protein|nr:helix-turn-helix domain-containing protein [Bacteroidota bacterium]MDF1863343.1 helix-turn-helix domain-containing protein [Saprospiraceae bacterium]